MADNKQLPPTGTGTADIVVATDEIAGVDYQRIKLVDGTDGATTGAKVSSEGNLQTITPNRTASGTIDAADEAVTLDTNGIGTIAWQVLVPSAFSGTLVAEGTFNGTDWVAINNTYWTADPEFGSITPPDQAWIADSGYTSVRLRCDAYTSGSCVVTIVGSSETSPNSGTVQRVAGSYPNDTFANIVPPVIVGAKASASVLTASEGNTTYLRADLDGSLVVTAASLPLPTGAATAALQLPDGHAVTVDNAAGAAAVNIQDGGNTITVDGTVTANLAAGTNNIGDVDVLSIAAGDNNIGNVDVVTLPALVAGSANIGDVDVLTVPAPLSTTGGGTEATALRVTVANNSTGVVAVTQSGTWDEVGINDSGNSITVDQATGTNLHTVVDSGTVTAVTSITNSVTVAGGAAHASPVSGNPNLVAGRASTAVPTDVGADGDAASMWTNRNGAQVMVQAPHVGLNSDPWNLVHEGAQYTTAQTSTVLVAGGASEKIVVTQCQIQAFSTTAGTVVVYFGTGAFARGTNRTIFDGEFAPSATLKPGAILTGPFISGANGDDILVTTVGDIDITISCWYYVVT